MAGSFSLLAKDELARRMPDKPCCLRAEFAGLLPGEGGGPALHGETVEWTTPNGAVARKLVLLLRRLLDQAVRISVKKRGGLQRRPTYVVTAQGLSEESAARLAARASPRRDCCRRAFLRGAFLSKGAVSDPHRTYHLEIAAPDEAWAELVRACLEALGLQPRVAGRRGGWVVYLKDGEQIAEALLQMGAHEALLSMEDTKIRKGMRNQINRLVNAETANVDKTVEAAMRQSEAIRLLDDAIGLHKLPAPLRHVARLRLQHPYASLGELGEMLSPPLSKSGMNHRMRRLMRLARQVQRGGPREEPWE